MLLSDVTFIYDTWRVEGKTRSSVSFTTWHLYILFFLQLSENILERLMLIIFLVQMKNASETIRRITNQRDRLKQTSYIQQFSVWPQHMSTQLNGNYLSYCLRASCSSS